MELLHDRDDRLPPDVSVVATIGVFDGVHVGHRRVLAEVRRRAGELEAGSAVVTFDTHPAHVVRPENAPALLTTLDQKLELLAEAGLDFAYVVHFDEDRAGTPPAQFVEEVFVDALHARAIVVGEDFHFGKERSGDVAELQRLGSAAGFTVHPLELIGHAADAVEPVSSTAIRRALAGGDVAAAAGMLGRTFEVRGTVERGDGRGREIGFPTANVPVAPRMAWPADAVYAGWCTLPDGGRHRAAINIGRRPTFHEHAEQSVLEVHLLDYNGDLYGLEVRVSFVEFVRSERKFDGVESLRQQLAHDIAAVRSLLDETAPS